MLLLTLECADSRERPPPSIHAAAAAAAADLRATGHFGGGGRGLPDTPNPTKPVSVGSFAKGFLRPVFLRGEGGEGDDDKC